MISAGENSIFHNADYNEKQGHVKSYIEDGKNDSIESLKMLYVYTHYGENWNDENIKKHQYEMLKLLKESFLDEN